MANTRSYMVKCPKCGGRGYLNLDQNNYLPNYTPNYFDGTKCHSCGGVGVISSANPDNKIK